MAERDNRINENTAAIHRKSVNEAFGVRPTPEPVKKPSPLEADAKELQALLGEDVVVKPSSKMAKGGKVSSASSRADGCAIKGKTRGRIV
jgi:hypothetical protein